MDSLLSLWGLLSQYLPDLSSVTGLPVALLGPLVTMALGHPLLTTAILLALYLSKMLRDPYWRAQVGRGGSRFLNGLCGGEGDSTFSAWSWELQLQNARWGKLRVAVLDKLNNPGHCQRAWDWHMLHHLIDRDENAAV